jgi:2-haloacid dehalogenase
LIQAVYSADEVRLLKPAPEPYRHVLNSQHIDAADAVLIAAHDWDGAGAAGTGLRAALITRNGRVPLPASPSPAISATSLHAIATELINQHSPLRPRPQTQRTSGRAGTHSPHWHCVSE